MSQRMAITTQQTKGSLRRAPAWLLALATSGFFVAHLSGCATETEAPITCEEGSDCTTAFAEREEVDESQEAMRSGGWGTSGDCALIQCNGQVNPFGTLVCYFGHCSCVGNGKVAACKSGETACRESCNTVVSPPGGFAP